MSRSNAYASPPAPGLSRELAAAYCGVCVRLLDQWRSDGTGPHCFHIGSVVRYWPAALDRFLDERPTIKSRALAFRKVCPYIFDPHIELVPAPTPVLLPHQVAERLGVCKRTLNYWRAWGCGPAFIKDDRNVRYTGQAIRAYIAYDIQQLAP